MKKGWLILFASVIICSSAFSQPYVVFDSVSGLASCGAPATFPFRAYIGIANPDFGQTSFRLVFSIESRNGTEIGGFLLSYLNGINIHFAGSGNLASYTEGTPSEQKLTIEGINGLLPVSSDTITYFQITFYTDVEMQFDSLCIDSSSSTTYGDWTFSNPTSISWSERKCIYISQFPGFGSVITNCPPSGVLNFSYCQTAVYDFNASNPEGNPFVFRLVAGPGAINQSTGVWSFQPGPENADDTFLIEVKACNDVCGDGTSFVCGTSCVVQVRINGGPPDNYPDYPGSQRFRFVAVSSETLSVQLQVTDPDSINNYQFAWYTGPQDPVPNWASINSSTGQFEYYGETADTGLYWIFNSVSECGEGDTIGFYVYHFEDYTCGDLNHDGTAGNILDLNWFIDYIFRGGPTPAPKEAGNVNCQPGVNTVDLNYIVNRIFRGGPPPCNACQQ